VFLWHLGATTALIRYAFRDPAMDLRFLALGAILPDLIDLPLGIALWGRFETPRLAAHSLGFAAVCMVVVLLATRRGPVRKQWMLVAVGVLVHLFLDAMWRQPETLWWPVLGSSFTGSGFGTYGAYVGDLLTQPVMWAGEVVGLVYLVVLARRSHMQDPDQRAAFRRTGKVSAPIGRV
jgi:membrane-bound metal-dependent hydrolase YbcI (DUF457 family)